MCDMLTFMSRLAVDSEAAGRPTGRAASIGDGTHYLRAGSRTLKPLLHNAY